MIMFIRKRNLRSREKFTKEKLKRKIQRCRNFKILSSKKLTFKIIIRKSYQISLKRFVGNLSEYNRIIRIEMISLKNKPFILRVGKNYIDLFIM